MIDDLKIILIWVAIGIAVSPIIVGLGWGIWECEIAPRLISRKEIKRLADEVTRKHPFTPQAAALIEEYEAYHRCEPTDQLKWRRVRKELERRVAVSNKERRRLMKETIQQREL